MGRINFDPQSKSIVIPLELESVNGKTTLTVRAVLDTGASMTIISWETALALGYDPATSSRRRRIITGSSIEYAPAITVRRLKAIGENINHIEVLCHDLPSESGIEGLLGLNFLRHFDLAIQFTRQIIELRRREGLS